MKNARFHSNPMVRKAYYAWKNARARCENHRNPKWDQYGARGIYMCKEWVGSFAAFLNEVGLPTHSNLSLERINNNGPYAPGNVKWGTKTEQSRNRSNSVITPEIAEKIRRFKDQGLSYTAIANRLGLNKSTVANVWSGKQFK